MRARTTLRLICVICLIVLFAPTSTAISARTKPDNYPPVLFLGTKSPPPMCSSNFDLTFQTLTNDPGVSHFAGDASVAKFSSTDVFEGIFFNVFKINSQVTWAVIGGRSGRNWGKLPFRTQFGGHRNVYERRRISSNGYVGIGTRTLRAKLEAAGGDFIIVDGDIYSRGRPIKDGLPGPQGCGHFQLQSQGRDAVALGRDYATATTSTQDLGQISIPVDLGAPNARIQLTPLRSPVFLINPSAGTAEIGGGILRIGRLELERKDNPDPGSDGPVRVDPSDMFRAALHMLPKPAISLAFNLHWAKR
jgi:hypothetical protein